MFLTYFDENKFSPTEPCFWVGGVIIDGSRASALNAQLRGIQNGFFGSSLLTRQTELHGMELFHGKGPCKGRPLADRVGVFEALVDFVIDNEVPIRLVCIDVPRHQAKYTDPAPEYSLGLMFFLERVCNYLDEIGSLGLIFGDIERTEMAQAVVDFSRYQETRTPMWFGRSLDPLVDTIYFTESHHSRFLQLADCLVYLAARYHGRETARPSWHDQRLGEAWQKIRANTDYRIKCWP